MPTLVTVICESTDPSKRLRVTSLKLTEGGREKHKNGEDLVLAGQKDSFVVHDTQEICVTVEHCPSKEEEEAAAALLLEVDKAPGEASTDGAAVAASPQA